MRSTFIVLASAAALVLPAAEAAGAPPPHARKFVQASNLLAPAPAFRGTVLDGRSAVVPRRFSDSGGVYKTADGISVRVVVSDFYPPDAAADQALVSMLGSLAHGPELGKLIVAVGSPDEVKELCGAEASGCYAPSLSTLLVPGEDMDSVPLEHVIAHEYGHHVAANRDNAPWSAADWGTKRWATYLGICAKADAGDVFPGNEAERYTLNPGEGFAEAYRYLNVTRIGAGWPPIGWNVVEPLFFPDATALRLVEQDVLEPWTRASTTELTGRLAAGKTRSYRLGTPLDGAVRASVTGKAGATVRFFTTGGQAITSAGRSIAATSCGGRTVVVRVKAKRAGAFRLSFSRA